MEALIEGLLKYQIGGVVLSNIVVTALIVTGTIQACPWIKWKPWTALTRAIAKSINAGQIEEIRTVRSEIMEIKLELKAHLIDEEQKEISEKRKRIISKAGDVKRGEQLTEEVFDDIFADIDYYEKYCASHPDFVNNKAERSIHFLKEKYDYCLNHDGFLEF